LRETDSELSCELIVHEEMIIIEEQGV